MPPSRSTHDPFTDAPLRPTNANTVPNPALRNQTSQQSLRSNASSASSRPRQHAGNLFAPTLSRRPTSRATPHVEDDVLADSDSETDVVAQKPKQSRRVRHGSPIVIKHERLKPKQEDEVDLVNRQPDGGYLLGVAGFGDAVVVPQMTVPMTEEEIEQDGLDAHYDSIARQFFASGASYSGRNSKKQEEGDTSCFLPTT